MRQAGPVSLLVSVCRDLDTFVKCNKKRTSRLHDNRASPVSRDHGIAVPRSRLTGLRFHVIAFAGSVRLIKPSSRQNQARSGLSRFIASDINRATSPHVITDLQVISAHRSSPANRASPAHVIRP